MGKWSKEFRHQLFGRKRNRETPGQRYIRITGHQIRLKSARDREEIYRVLKSLGLRK